MQYSVQLLRKPNFWVHIEVYSTKNIIENNLPFLGCNQGRKQGVRAEEILPFIDSVFIRYLSCTP